MSLLDIFSPYLKFIVILITLGANLLLIFKSNTRWQLILTLNVIISIILNLIGLGEYDMITTIVTSVIDIIRNLINGIFDGLGGSVWDFIKGIFKF